MLVNTLGHKVFEEKREFKPKQNNGKTLKEFENITKT